MSAAQPRRVSVNRDRALPHLPPSSGSRAGGRGTTNHRATLTASEDQFTIRNLLEQTALHPSVHNHTRTKLDPMMRHVIIDRTGSVRATPCVQHGMRVSTRGADHGVACPSRVRATLTRPLSDEHAGWRNSHSSLPRLRRRASGQRDRRRRARNGRAPRPVFAHELASNARPSRALAHSPSRLPGWISAWPGGCDRNQPGASTTRLIAC